jgi:hypothetical protein
MSNCTTVLNLYQLYNSIKYVLLCHINYLQERGSEVSTSVVRWSEVQLREVQ